MSFETFLWTLHAAAIAVFIIAGVWVIVTNGEGPYPVMLFGALAVLVLALLRWGFGFAPWWWPVLALAVFVSSLLSWRAARERAGRSSG